MGAVLLSFILLAASAFGFAYASRVHRRGWCDRKGGGRILREVQPRIFWYEVVSVTLLSVVSLGVALVLLVRHLG